MSKNKAHRKHNDHLDDNTSPPDQPQHDIRDHSFLLDNLSERVLQKDSGSFAVELFLLQTTDFWNSSGPHDPRVKAVVEGLKEALAGRPQDDPTVEKVHARVLQISKHCRRHSAGASLASVLFDKQHCNSEGIFSICNAMGNPFVKLFESET